MILFLILIIFGAVVTGILFARFPVDATLKIFIWLAWGLLLVLWFLMAFGVIGDYGFFPRHSITVH